MPARRRKTYSYLFTSGALLETFEEVRDGVIIGNTADITYGYCEVFLYRSDADQYRFHPEKNTGRISIRDEEGFIKLAKGGRISAHAPDVAAGSEKSKQLGQAFQGVTLTTKAGIKLSWFEATSLVSSHFHVQLSSESNPKQYTLDENLKKGDILWTDLRIWNVKDLRKKEVPTPASATLGDNDGKHAPGF